MAQKFQSQRPMSMTMKELSHLCWRCRARWFAAPRGQTAPRVRFGHSQAQVRNSAEPFASEDSRATRNSLWETSAQSVEGPGALAIFQSVVEEQRHRKHPAALTVSKGSLGVLTDISELTAMMDKYAASIECFQFFNANIYPRIRKSSEHVPSIVRQRVGLLFARISEEKARDCSATNMPRVARITEMLIELGLFHPDKWAELILRLAEQACRISTLEYDYDSPESHEHAMARRNYLVLDLWDSWKAFNFHPFLASRVGDTEEAAEWTPMPCAPSDLGKMPSGFSPKNKVAKALWRMFPALGRVTPPSVISASVATFLLLGDPATSLGAAQQEATSFSQTLYRVFADAGLAAKTEPTELMEALKARIKLKAFVRYNWGVAMERAESSKEPKMEPRESRLGPVDSKSIRDQLDRVMKNRNTKLAKDTWLAFWGGENESSAERRRSLKDCPDVFDHFIQMYMSIRQPKLAVEVWESMESIGIPATLKTWTSMMEGCRRAKNAGGSHTVWEKLKTSGLQLDVVVWTSRIGALIECNEIEAGLQALNEMDLLWKNKDDPANRLIAVEPSIGPVNAVLVSLLRWQKPAAVKSVLAWAASRGIQPDIITFNILLRPMVRGGHDNEVRNVLQMMKAMEIEADTATYTILLDGTIGRFKNQTAEQQDAAVQRILDGMEEAGVKMNMQAYGKIVYLLLRRHDQTDQVIYTVLQHIRRKGFRISSYIYTILAEHWIYQGPAGLEKVAAMIRDEGLENNRDIDRVFWERLIIAYCRLGKVAEAWDAYKMISSSGATIIYTTLHELLSTLIVHDNWKAAAELVATAEEDERRSEPESGQSLSLRVYKHKFWHLVKENGLMSEETEARFREAGQL